MYTTHPHIRNLHIRNETLKSWKSWFVLNHFSYFFPDPENWMGRCEKRKWKEIKKLNGNQSRMKGNEAKLQVAWLKMKGICKDMNLKCKEYGWKFVFLTQFSNFWKYLDFDSLLNRIIKSWFWATFLGFVNRSSSESLISLKNGDSEEIAWGPLRGKPRFPPMGSPGNFLKIIIF